MQSRKNILALAITSVLVIICSSALFAQSGQITEREALKDLFQDGAQSLSDTQRPDVSTHSRQTGAEKMQQSIILHS